MLTNKRNQIVVFLLLAIGVYANSLLNDYALDDRAVITDNNITKKGISGIKDIFTHYYYYDGINHNTHTYRPVTSLSHAIEWQIFKKNPFVSHSINLLLYLLTLFVLYQLLYFLFEKTKQHSFIPFTATILFAIHPVHTEVVANIKGRDEILSLLFMLIAIYYIINNQASSFNSKTFLISGTLFFTALLCKENAFLFLLYFPLFNYFFTSETFLNSIRKTLPYLLFVFVYVIILYKVIGFGEREDRMILNVPYLYASNAEAFATKIFILIKYAGLLLVPYPLICDYTYNHIPYLSITDYRFIISLLFNCGLLLTSLLLFKKKNIYSFCILFYFISISIVSNLILQSGVIMAERSLYVGSLGYCLCLAFLLHNIVSYANKMNKRYIMYLSYSFFIVIVSCYSVLAINRNKDWKSDYYLFTHDVKYAPNSAKLLQLSGYFDYFLNPSIKEGQLPDQITRGLCINRLKKSIQILPVTLPESYIYLSYIYISIDSLETALNILNAARQNNMNTPQMLEAQATISNRYLSFGDSCFQNKDVNRALLYFKKAMEVNDNNARAWWNYGGICLDRGDKSSAIAAWEKVISIDPSYPKANELLQVVKNSTDTLAHKPN